MSGTRDQGFGARDQVSGISGTASGDSQVSGISGTVYRLSGNHMPAPNRRPHPPVDSARNSGARHPGVKATVCIFPLTSDSQVIRPTGAGAGSPYYKAVLTHLIRQVDTDDKGTFQVALPPGTYSVFTKNGDLFYATQRDENNNIAPVKVLPGKITRIQCSVESDHTVVY
jgi:hypothetical protein